MTKSYVTILKCPWCKKDTESLAIDKRLKEIFEMYTEDNKPCDKCMKKAILLYDEDTKVFLAYIKKDAVMKEDKMKQYEDTSVRALGKIMPDGSIKFSQKQPKNKGERE